MKKCPNCGEMIGDNVTKCFNCQIDITSFQKEMRKINGEYEYRVLKVSDESDGSIGVAKLETTINDMASKGWRLIAVTNNELGRNRVAVVNATMDETILFFERKIKN